jgi:hypothetical protein
MMKKLLFFSLLLYYLPLHSQVVTVADFINLADLADKKLSTYVGKIGFVQVARNFDNGAWINEFAYRNKKQPEDTVVRFISGYKRGKISGVVYETSSFAERDALLRAFMLNGFLGNREDSALKADSVMRIDTTKMDSALFLQKEDITIHISESVREELRYFKFSLERKPVPTKSSIRFADDLLVFDSHETLVAMFGNTNVKRDVYFFSQTDSSRCSVIFPNSNRQAIFIWDDQAKDRGLSFLMIGGSLKPEGQSNLDQSVALSAWRSYSGLYTGMRLAEIVRINESDFEFYGLASEFAYMVVPTSKGNVDFKKTGITLGCLNCSGSPLIRKEKISAEAALESRLQLYISSIVLIP